MFGLFKKKAAPEGPVEINATLDVEASAEEFFALIDFANANNAKVQLGHRVDPLGDDRFRLVMTFLPDLEFELKVEERITNRRYAYYAPLPEGTGQLLWTREEFDIEATGEHSCRVSHKTYGEFAKGLDLSTYQDEVAMLAAGVENAILKLKAHAEGGIEQVRAFEEGQLEWSDLPDCTDDAVPQPR